MTEPTKLDQRMINNNCGNKPIRMKILQSEPTHIAYKNEETKLYNEAYKSPIRFLLDTLDPGYIEYKGVDIELLTKYCQIHKDNISTEKLTIKFGNLSTIIEIIGAIGKNKNDDLKPLQKRMVSALATYVQQNSSFPIEVTHSTTRNYSEIMTVLDSASLTKLSHMFKQGEYGYTSQDFYCVGNKELKKGYSYFYESASIFKRTDGSTIEDKPYDYFNRQNSEAHLKCYRDTVSAMNHQLIANEIIEGTIKKVLDNKALTPSELQEKITNQLKQTLEQKEFNYLSNYQGEIQSFFSKPSVQAKLEKLASEMSKVEVKAAINELENNKKHRFRNKEFLGDDVVYGYKQYHDGVWIENKPNEGNTVYRDVLAYLTLGISSLIFELLDYLGITESCYQAAEKNAKEQDATATIELKEETKKHIEKEAFDDLLPLFLSLKQNEEKQSHSREEKVGSQASGQTKPSGPPPYEGEEGAPGLSVSNPQRSPLQGPDKIQ